MPLKPDQIKKLRSRAGLTQTEAANCVHVALRTWQSWESSKDDAHSRQMSDAHVELFCLKNKISFPPKF